MSANHGTDENATDRQRILKTLAQLGGEATREDDVTFKGTQLVIPERMSLQSASKFIAEKIAADEEDTKITRTYNYRPTDGAFNAWMAIKELFGMAKGQATYSMFGKNPPELRSIPVGVDENEQVPSGWVAVPLLERGSIGFGAITDPERGQLFQLVFEGPRKYRNEIEGLFNFVGARLKTNSIYAGQAINGRPIPDFIDLSGVDPAKVVYSQHVLDQLNGNVWSIIEQTDRMRELGISRKRACLFEGPYGTGKSLASMITAQKAVENGWTFLQCRPGRDSLREVMSTAALYQPSVVFFEDVDVVAEGASTDKDAVSELLDIFDGITAKGTEILVVLTTNHVEKIHRGMLRPGRLDAVISIDALDEAGIQKLVTVTIPAGMIDTTAVDWQAVCQAMDGFLPAFIVETASRAVRYSVGRGDGLMIETSDLVQAANGIRPQLDLMNGAAEGKARLAVDEAIGEVVSTVVDSRIEAMTANLDANTYQIDFTAGGQADKLEAIEAGL